MPIDSFASYPHYYEHILPIHEVIGGRLFYTTPSTKRPGTITRGLPRSDDWLIVAGYPDLKRTRRPTVFVEHGIGETYNLTDSHYAGGTGRERVKLFLCPNQKVFEANEARYPGRSVIVGSPRVESLIHRAGKRGEVRDRRLRVAVSFHWQCRIHPQAGTALFDFQPHLKHWATDPRIELVGHAHPRIGPHAERIYNAAGIPYVESFDDVIEWADVYAVDNSSTLFEAAAVGLDVVVMDSPHYTAEETGFRFWKYADIGPRISPGDELGDAAIRSHAERISYADLRHQMVAEIFGTIEGSTTKAVAAIRTVINGQPSAPPAADSGTDATQSHLFG
jgi:hypothetical protein